MVCQECGYTPEQVMRLTPDQASLLLTDREALYKKDLEARYGHSDPQMIKAMKRTGRIKDG